MSGESHNIDNYIMLKPVRLEDFKCSNNQSYPTPVQLVKHFSQVDQHWLNYAGVSAFVNFTSPLMRLAEDEPSPLLQIPNWQLTSESNEDGESAFPWLPSHPQAVLYIPDESEDLPEELSKEEEKAVPASSPPPSHAHRPVEQEIKETVSKCENDVQSKKKKKKRQHTCTICKKSYRLQSSLDKHLRVPCELRPYKCDICKKAFKRPDHLKAHCRMHTGERPFLCSLCGKTFRQKNHLQRHSERKHINGQLDEDEEELEPDQNSSFDVCGLEDLEDDEMRTEDQD